MRIDKPDPRIGAIATDVDVRSLSDADWNQLYRAWLDGIVLVVRGQTLTIPEFLAYSHRFGTRKPDGQIDKTIYDRGGGWHTDSPWDQEICKGTQLYGIAIPSIGGDTLFASMYDAYATLPEKLKQRVQGLKAEHVYGGRGR